MPSQINWKRQAAIAGSLASQRLLYCLSLILWASSASSASGGGLLAIAEINGTLRLAEINTQSGEVTSLVDSGLTISGVNTGVEALDPNTGRFFFRRGFDPIAADIVTISLTAQLQV